MMNKGVVKTYKPERGFGFIKIDTGDLFFHVSDVIDYKEGSLYTGVNVEFSLGRGRDGKAVAKRVRVLGADKETVNNKHLYLPKDTADILDVKGIENYNLQLNRVPYVKDSKCYFYIGPEPKKGQEEVDHFSTVFPQIDFETIVKRLRYALECSGLKVLPLTFETDWRLIVGLGAASVYETSMTLHHVYGIPYIPGSSVKGVLRNYLINKYFKCDEDEALNDPAFCRIFGSPSKSVLGAKKGDVFFLDAFPVERPTIKRDIMNPHFGSYYTAGNPPADDGNPVPVPFLTVENTKFQFFFAVEGRNDVNFDLNWESEGETLERILGPLDFVAEFLPHALSWHGIGAKTAVGYGYLSSVKTKI